MKTLAELVSIILSETAVYDAKLKAVAEIGKMIADVGRKQKFFVQAEGKGVAWLDKYDAMRAEGWTWRKAAYIAWASTPAEDRWPADEMQLATRVLGMNENTNIEKWLGKDPRIEERIRAELI